MLRLIILELGNFSMLSSSKTKAVGLIAIITLASPARAQIYDPNTISAGDSRRYAGYYAPYAILADATYYPGTLKAGDDGNAAINWMFTDKNVGPIVQSAKGKGETTNLANIQDWSNEAIGYWRYQFGDDAKELCFRNNRYCKDHAPYRWQVHYPGPKFQVWAKRDLSHESGRAPPQSTDSCSEVSIGFRGTTSNRGDWISDARFVPGIGLRYDTSYAWLRRNIDAIMTQIRGLDCYTHAKSPPIIVSVGHSLGGGLAQFAALANDPTQPRIEKVFAFDSSPETGGDLVEERILRDNATGLEIDRIGQVEDASKYLQVAATVVPFIAPYVHKIPYGSSLINEMEFFPADDSRCGSGNPAIRHVRIDVDSVTGSPVELHSMALTTAQLVVWSGRERMEKKARNEVYESQEPGRMVNCSPTRYYIRKYEAVPAPASGQIAYAPPAQRVVAAPQLTQITSLGARQARSTPAQTEVANLSPLLALFAPQPTSVARKPSQLGGPPPAAPTQVAVLDRRQVLPARALTHLADVMERRSQLRHFVRRDQGVRSAAVASPTSLKARQAATISRGVSNRKPTIVGAL